MTAVDLTSTPFEEGSLVTYTASLVDGSGAPVDGASLTSMTLTMQNPYSGQPVNGVLDEDILNVGRGTINSAGLVTIRLGPSDTTKATSLSLEKRRLWLQWTHAGEAGHHFVDIALAVA